MDNEERDKTIKEMEEFSENITPEEAKDMLINMGINNKDGTLTEAYRPYITTIEYERKFIFENPGHFLYQKLKQRYNDDTKFKKRFKKYKINQIYITPDYRIREIIEDSYKFLPKNKKYVIEKKDNTNPCVMRYEETLYHGDALDVFFNSLMQDKFLSISKTRYVYEDPKKIIKNISFDSFERMHIPIIEVEFFKDTNLLLEDVRNIICDALELKYDFNFDWVGFKEVTGDLNYYSYYIAKEEEDG